MAAYIPPTTTPASLNAPANGYVSGPVTGNVFVDSLNAISGAAAPILNAGGTFLDSLRALKLSRDQSMQKAEQTITVPDVVGNTSVFASANTMYLIYGGLAILGAAIVYRMVK
jgi:hypothetical protein